ncbi:hypothetical protein XELAEV_18042354mg [Xenopus laevis]|uniref:Uncharacterized protein n=1 Tax=Xenopus laevis TaxID=8355 RepID=A0A974C3Z6_XENLA|nr:hypothetical protein XELAEV_18042354mg [Xenopus laevis]
MLLEKQMYSPQPVQQKSKCTRPCWKATDCMTRINCTVVMCVPAQSPRDPRIGRVWAEFCSMSLGRGWVQAEL